MDLWWPVQHVSRKNTNQENNPNEKTQNFSKLHLSWILQTSGIVRESLQYSLKFVPTTFTSTTESKAEGNLVLTRARSGSFSIFNNFSYQRRIEAFRGDKKSEGRLNFTKERANMPLKAPKGISRKEFIIALMIVNWSWNLRMVTKSMIRHYIVAMVTRFLDKVLRARLLKDLEQINF